MKEFEYQCSNGNTFYTRIEVMGTHNGKRIYKGIMLYGSPGRSRWGKSYRSASWYIDTFENAMLEMDSADFTPGIKKVKDWEDEKNIY